LVVGTGNGLEKGVFAGAVGLGLLVFVDSLS
jgi:hypothetical protein